MKLKGWTASEASAAPVAAADGQTIAKRHAAAPEGTAAAEAEGRNEKDERIRALVQERKTISKHEKDRIREISKKIKKCIRDNKRMKRQKHRRFWKKLKLQETSPVSNRFKSVSSSPRSEVKKVKPSRRDRESRMCFSKFYEDLYEGEEENNEDGTDSRTDNDEEDSERNNSIKEFTTNEIQDAIDRLNKCKAIYSNGIRAEQLKNCSDDTKENIRTIYNENVQQEDSTPKCWRKIRIQVIDKKGTGKIQAITGQFAACQFYTSCLPKFYMPGLHLVYTKYNLQIKQDFGLTIDVKTTLWCIDP